MDNVERLDFTKPPRGYHIAWSTHGPREWSFTVGPHFGPHDDLCNYASEVEVITAAWAWYKARHDPPGMLVEGEGDHWDWSVLDFEDPVRAVALLTNGDDEHQKIREAARAAAWGWYERRLALARGVEVDPRFRIDHCGGPGSCGAENEPQTDDRCPTCGKVGTLVSTWGAAQAARYRSGARYTTHEADQDDGPGVWPHCLAWSDDLAAEVEHWRADPAATELPAVLADVEDEGPHVCTGCLGDGPCELEVGALAEFCDACGAARDEACLASCPWRRELGGEG